MPLENPTQESCNLLCKPYFNCLYCICGTYAKKTAPTIITHEIGSLHPSVQYTDIHYYPSV